MGEYKGTVVQFTDSDGNTYDLPSGGGGAAVADNYVYVAASGNLEISSDPQKPQTPVPLATDAKLNLDSKGDIQVKPGISSTIQFDNEKSNSVAKDAYEIPFKVCNGALPKATRVVGTKWNTASWTFDTQKVNSTQGQGAFDPENFIMQFRLDKWNSGEWTSNTGPIQVKLKARSFDIRCHDHGGVALQPAGHDGQNHENKIKFESSRTSNIEDEGNYVVEGGKGLEFGTFNNLHTSIFTGDYRFKGNALVYGARRGALVTESGKTDYPTQSDDFKDILTDSLSATWDQICAAGSCVTIDYTNPSKPKIDQFNIPKKFAFNKQVSFMGEGDESGSVQNGLIPDDIKFLHLQKTAKEKTKLGHELIKFVATNNSNEQTLEVTTIEGNTITIPAKSESTDPANEVTVGRVDLWDLVKAVHDLSGSTLKYLFKIDGVSNNATMGTVSGSGTYYEGTGVTLTATALEGYEFVSWSSGDTDASITKTASKDATYIATFQARTP